MTLQWRDQGSGSALSASLRRTHTSLACSTFLLLSTTLILTTNQLQTGDTDQVQTAVQIGCRQEVQIMLSALQYRTVQYRTIQYSPVQCIPALTSCPPEEWDSVTWDPMEPPHPQVKSLFPATMPPARECLPWHENRPSVPSYGMRQGGCTSSMRLVVSQP